MRPVILAVALADLSESGRALAEGAPAPPGTDHVVLPYRGAGRSVVVEADGLLGMSFLRHFRVTLDPDRRTLTLERR